ncbi:MAG: Gfo/Idh/MocA family oxidoreductase [Planctomycetota bacterium]|nr:Gfo/Idh/MocA family oxidoreductase [Planctomycetota bacterium]
MASFLRCAVIGLGMGKHHADGYAEHPEARLVAVADTDAKRAHAYADKIGKENCFTDYETMLRESKPDLVSVVLPNYLHAPVTIRCLKAGAHVLCEKPMALSVREARQMLAAAKQARRKLSINLSYRFAPQSRALKELANAGFLGTAYHAYTSWTRRDGIPGMGGWFGQKALSGGGPLIDLGVHRLDLAMWLMGSPQPVTVSGSAHHHVGVPRAKAAGKKFDVEDFASGFVRFSNGASLVFEISWAGHQGEPEKMATIVTGTKGSLVQRNEGGGYNFVAEFHTVLHGEKVSGAVMAPKSGGKTAYGEMVDSVLYDKPLVADGYDGLRMQQVLDGLYASAAAGREVRIKP